jgi:hypothetical protein
MTSTWRVGAPVGRLARDGGGGTTHGGALVDEGLRAGRSKYEGDARIVPDMTKGVGSHPIDGSRMRRRKRDGAPVFAGDGGLMMASGEFGDPKT